MGTKNCSGMIGTYCHAHWGKPIRQGSVLEQPWGCREVWLEDPDHNRLRIGTRVDEGDAR